MSRLSRFFILILSTAVFGLGGASLAWSAESAPSSTGNSDSPAPPAVSAPSAPINTDPSYRLSPGDTISIGVQGEGDLSTTQTLSRSGEIRVTYITNDVTLSGKTVREAETFLENLYRDKNILKKPVVLINITGYSPREVSVLGSVRTPGPVSFPRDLTSMDLVDVITRAGGFTPLSKQDSVSVTHRGADGKESTQIVDLENAISNKRKLNKDRAEFLVFPGDRIFVPEHFF